MSNSKISIMVFTRHIHITN